MQQHAQPIKIAVLISGFGSNLQAIIDAVAKNKINAEITAVISDRADAYGLLRAKQAGISTEIIDVDDKYASNAKLKHTLLRYSPDLIVLAGYMRIISSELVHYYQGQMLNIHPALLPKYRGLRTHERVLASDDTQHGASVHFVTETLDGGPIIAQAAFPIQPDDTVKTLKQRVQSLEHQLYPQVITWFCERRLRLTSKGVQFDGKIIAAEGIQLKLQDLDRRDTKRC